MANTTKQNLGGAVLSAVELHGMHPNWVDLFIEDYLNRFNNENILADAIDTIAPPDTSAVARSYFYGRTY